MYCDQIYPTKIPDKFLENLTRKDGKYHHIQKMTLAESGKYFGYPQCCIDFFVNMNTERMKYLHTYTPYVHKWTSCQTQLKGTIGFLPCRECAYNIVHNGVLPHELIKNRECELEFPNGCGMRGQLQGIFICISNRKHKLKRILKMIKCHLKYNIDIDILTVVYNKINVNKFIKMY